MKRKVAAARQSYLKMIEEGREQNWARAVMLLYLKCVGRFAYCYIVAIVE
jgi:hypothetical protein